MIGAGFGDLLYERVVAGFSSKDMSGTSSGRTEIWATAIAMMFEHPLTESLAGWVMGGAAFDHTEVEIDGESVGDSDHGFGWEAGAGVSFAVSDRISLLPGVRYRSFTPDLGESEDDPSVSYLAAEIGLSWKL